MSDNQIIQLIKEGREDRAFYKLYRYLPQVKALIKKHGGTADDAMDIFQDALVLLCHKVKNEDFELTSSLNTYLYGVCHNLWRNQQRKSKPELSEEIHLSTSEEVQEDESESRLLVVEQALRDIGEKCLELLQLFYVRSMSMKDIADKMGLKTVNAAKTQKYKCIERARKKAFSHYQSINS